MSNLKIDDENIILNDNRYFKLGETIAFTHYVNKHYFILPTETEEVGVITGVRTKSKENILLIVTHPFREPLSVPERYIYKTERKIKYKFVDNRGYFVKYQDFVKLNEHKSEDEVNIFYKNLQVLRLMANIQLNEDKKEAF
jgi:hypothetical protein